MNPRHDKDWLSDHNGSDTTRICSFQKEIQVSFAGISKLAPMIKLQIRRWMVD